MYVAVQMVTGIFIAKVSSLWRCFQLDQVRLVKLVLMNPYIQLVHDPVWPSICMIHCYYLKTTTKPLWLTITISKSLFCVTNSASSETVYAHYLHVLPMHGLVNSAAETMWDSTWSGQIFHINQHIYAYKHWLAIAKDTSRAAWRRIIGIIWN